VSDEAVSSACEFAVSQDRLRVAEILALPEAESNWRVAASLAASGASVEKARSILSTAAIANALVDDARDGMVRAN
jgi:hypothetical protein